MAVVNAPAVRITIPLLYTPYKTNLCHYNLQIVAVYGHITGRKSGQICYNLRAPSGSKGPSNCNGPSGNGNSGGQCGTTTTTSSFVGEDRMGFKPPGPAKLGESRERIMTNDQLDLESGIVDHHSVTYAATAEPAGGDAERTKSVPETETLQESPPHTAHKMQSRDVL